MNIFFLYLLSAAWQDMRFHSISRGCLLFFGAAGIFFRIGSGEELWSYILSSGIGGMLLFLSTITGGEIGRGDGWFFAVAGLYLKLEENLDDNGFCLYLPSELVAADGNDVEILIEKDNKIYNIYQNNIKEDSIQ